MSRGNISTVDVNYDAIDEALKAKGLTQIVLSTELGFDKSWYSNARKKAIAWKESIARHAALFLGMSYTDMLVTNDPVEINDDDTLKKIYEKLVEISNRTIVIKKELDELKEQKAEPKPIPLAVEIDYVKRVFATTQRMYENKIMKDARMRGFTEEDIRSAMKQLGFTHTAVKGNGNTYQRLWTRPDTYKEAI